MKISIPAVVLVLTAYLTNAVSAMEFTPHYNDLRPIMEPTLSITMSGEITPEDPERLRQLLATYDGKGLRSISVNLDSPGGSLIAGIEMGLILNKRPEDVSTNVSNIEGDIAFCASACTLLYLGGHYRHMTNGSKLGVHQFSREEHTDAFEAFSSAQVISSMIVNYITQMRADPALFEKMSSMSPDDIGWLSDDELKYWNIVTGSVLSEVEEYINLDGTVGLKLFHSGSFGESSMIIFCGNIGLSAVAKLSEPPLNAIGHLMLVADGEEYKIKDFRVISAGEGETTLAFFFPTTSIRIATARAKTFGVRVYLPSGYAFYGFEQTIHTPKLKEIVESCRNNASENPNTSPGHTETTRTNPAPAINQDSSTSNNQTPDYETLMEDIKHLSGRDFPGMDLTTNGFKNVSLHQCKRICVSNSSCKAFSYVSTQKWCWPKYGISKSIFKRNVVSGKVR